MKLISEYNTPMGVMRHEVAKPVFTLAERDTLLNLVSTERESGCYFGNREQYYRRLERIGNKLFDMYKENK